MPSLIDAARNIVENPSLGRRIFHSKALLSFRRGKDAPLATVGSAVTKLGSAVLSHIPVPVVPDLAKAAWGFAAKAIRGKSHERNLESAANADDKVKFTLKELGGDIEKWDGYRWKIHKAIKEVNEEIDKQRNPGFRTCQQWVDLFEKVLYARRRIKRLRDSIAAVRGVLDATEQWLDQVDNVQQQHENSFTNAYANWERVALDPQFAALCAQCDPECCVKSPRTPTSAPPPDSLLGFVQTVGDLGAEFANAVVDTGGNVSATCDTRSAICELT